MKFEQLLEIAVKTLNERQLSDIAYAGTVTTIGELLPYRLTK